MGRNRRSILFVNQHYYPAFVSAGQYLTDLAEHVAQSGMEVRVLCGSTGYEDEVSHAPKYEIRNGVEIRRLKMPTFRRLSYIGRVIEYAIFFTKVVIYLMAGRRYDYVVTLTTPPLLCIAATLASKLRSRPYGVWSMDLHPDAEEALGILRRRGRISRLLHALNNSGYRNAEFVVDLGRHMNQRIIEKGVEHHRLYTISLWCSENEIVPISRENNPLAKELGISDKFIVMYSGNAGLAHPFEEITNAMLHLKGDQEIYFVFIGSGAKKREIMEFVRENRISNFRYLNYFQRDQIKYSISLADVHLISLHKSMSGVAVPSKIYGIMAAGRPVLMIGPKASEPAELIDTGGFGRVIEPVGDPIEDSRQVSNAILRLRADDAGRIAMGRRARHLFEAKYEQRLVCSEWEKLLRRIHDKRASMDC